MYLSPVNVVITWTVLLSTLSVSSALKLFHEGSRVTFRPESSAEYFGFCVVLNRYGLIVGAPKAAMPRDNIKPGGVFNCSTLNLDVNDVTCELIAPTPDQSKMSSWYGRSIPNTFFKDDMWFGAVLTFLSDSKLLINAPRWTSNYGEHLVSNGVSYFRTRTRRDMIVYLLNESNRQAYRTDGRRREFGEYGTHLNYYAYGQAGFSAKVTKNNTVIFGAPGILQWAGGIVSYSYETDENNFFMRKGPIANPYFTKDIGPDEYFGYSVDSGVFERSGRVLYVAAAPRSKMGNGLVLVYEPPIRESQSLNILAKIEGPQLGAYFGGSLCCTDIDGDGLDDLLVGAPMYVRKDGGLPHDQGAVFVYMSQKPQSSAIVLKASGKVTGSEADGARFGTTIADLGDIDGDGFTDIAIGAPWENGKGAVYIYRGSSQGLRRDYSQRIEPQEAKGFGISISKGLDVDHNNSTDLAIGAYLSERVYVYRSVHTMVVSASIQVPDAVNLQNATNFTALFCVTAKPTPSWQHVEMDLIGRITVDPEGNRAMISGDSEYKIKIKTSTTVCDEQTVEVRDTADLTKPLSLIFKLESAELMKDNDTNFLTNAVRLSEDSKLATTFFVQVGRDCGEDMICTPWLVMELDALDDPYIPGSTSIFGVKVKVTNKEEPAYGAKVSIVLPFQPKRLPSECSLKSFNLTCNVPSPLNRNEDVVWEIEMDYTSHETHDLVYVIKANLTDPLYRNVIANASKKIFVHVTPVANFTVNGKSLPNVTLPILRAKLSTGDNVTFKHFYEIRNYGPSDWLTLRAQILLPDKIHLTSEIKGCENGTRSIWCEWSVPAQVSLPIIIPLRFDLSEHGEFMETNTTYNITSGIVLRIKDDIIFKEITSTLILEPANVIWPIILGAVVVGLFLLAIIIYSFKRFGFFMRKKREEMKNLINSSSSEQEHSLSEATSLPDDASRGDSAELLDKDDDSD